jgi:hypothetical protein
MIRKVNIDPSSLHAGIGVSVASLGIGSYKRVYRRHESISIESSETVTNQIIGVTFPLMYVIVHVEKGVVKVSLSSHAFSSLVMIFTLFSSFY